MHEIIQILENFSTEFILIELIILCCLIVIYTYSFVLKRRKLGIIETHIPAGPVKDILTNFIILAQSLRSELFGSDVLFNKGSSVVITQNGSPSQSENYSADVQSLIVQQENKIKELETKNLRLETENNQLLSNGGNTKELDTLKEKYTSLEARLEEYAIIEDDLANLKSIMQENNQLREQIKKFLNQLGSEDLKKEPEKVSEGTEKFTEVESEKNPN